MNPDSWFTEWIQYCGLRQPCRANNIACCRRYTLYFFRYHQAKQKQGCLPKFPHKTLDLSARTGGSADFKEDLRGKNIHAIRIRSRGVLCTARSESDLRGTPHPPFLPAKRIQGRSVVSLGQLGSEDSPKHPWPRS